MSDNGHKTINLPANITIRDLAQAINASPIEVIKTLMANGVMANINQQIDFDTAAIVVAEMGFEATLETPEIHEDESAGEIPLWRRVIAGEDPSLLGQETACCHNPGPCRSWKNHLTGCHPPYQCGRRRSRWYHPTHWRLSG